MAADPDPSSPWWGVIQGLATKDDVSGDPWCAAGHILLERGEVLAAITAFENAILFERGWSERFHDEAFAGIEQAAKKLDSERFFAYLGTMGED